MYQTKPHLDSCIVGPETLDKVEDTVGRYILDIVDIEKISTHYLLQCVVCGNDEENLG